SFSGVRVRRPGDVAGNPLQRATSLFAVDIQHDDPGHCPGSDADVGVRPAPPPGANLFFRRKPGLVFLPRSERRFFVPRPEGNDTPPAGKIRKCNFESVQTPPLQLHAISSSAACSSSACTSVMSIVTLRKIAL